MATKTGPKGKGPKTKKATPKSIALAKAVKAGDTTAALMAVSVPATAAESANTVILQCIVAAFGEQGLNHVNGATAKIVWDDIPNNVVVRLGDNLTDCLEEKGIHVPELAVAFRALKDSGQTTVVGDLVAAIQQLAG